MSGMSRQAAHEREMRERALEMIASPNKWPAWPQLPLMRLSSSDGTDLTDCGYLLEESRSQGYRVHIGNIYCRSSAWGADVETYDTVDQLLAVWRVD